MKKTIWASIIASAIALTWCNESWPMTVTEENKAKVDSLVSMMWENRFCEFPSDKHHIFHDSTTNQIAFTDIEWVKIDTDSDWNLDYAVSSDGTVHDLKDWSNSYDWVMDDTNNQHYNEVLESQDDCIPTNVTKRSDLMFEALKKIEK